MNDTMLRILKHISVFLFAISSWVTVNGLWVETPLLVARLPEEWALPSYLIIISQMANIGPVVYLLASRYCKSWIMTEHIVIPIILMIGMASCLLMSQFWDVTYFLGGTERSCVFFIVSFFMALCDCTSSVTFLPYMRYLRSPSYMTTFYIGEGFSGLLPALVAIVQGIGSSDNSNTSALLIRPSIVSPIGSSNLKTVFNGISPRISISAFMLIVFGMMAVSLAAFLFLDLFLLSFDETLPQRSSYEEMQDISGSFTVAEDLSGNEDRIYLNPGRDTFVSSGRSDRIFGYSYHTLCSILLVGVVSFLGNGLLPSLQSYSTLNYSEDIYHFVATFTNVINPLACSLTLFVFVRRLRILAALLAGSAACASYIMVCAFLSPSPPLKSYLSGSVLIFAAWLLFTAQTSFFKNDVAIAMQKKGHTPLQYCGLATQIGSAAGATVSFLLVNVFNLFHSADVVN